MLHTLQLQNIPEPHEVHIALFSNVTNAAMLRDKLLEGDETFQYAFIDAKSVISTTHLLAAVQQAIHSQLISKKLRTRNVHSEIVFSLSPTNNISEAFRRFGVSPETTSLLCVKVSTTEAPFSKAYVEQHLKEIVNGVQEKFAEETLAAQVDWKKVAKYYKVKAPTMTAGVPVDIGSTELAIMGKLVMRTVG